MTAKEMLEKAGWVRVKYQKRGCMIIAEWRDRKTGQVYRQGGAVMIQRDRDDLKRRTPKVAGQWIPEGTQSGRVVAVVGSSSLAIAVAAKLATMGPVVSIVRELTPVPPCDIKEIE